MNLVGIAIGLMAFAVVGMLGLIIYFNVVKKVYKKNSALFKKDEIKIKKKINFGEIFNKIYQKFYIIAINMPIIKFYTRKTRLKLEMVNDYTEYEIRKKTGSIMLLSVIFIFASLFILMSIVSDLYMILIVIISVFMINGKIIDLRVTSVADKIMRQLPEVFTEMRHSFHEHGMVEESLNDAIDELGEKEIVSQIRKIKAAITDDNPEVQLEKYYDTAPNRFLKLFAGVSYLTMELGDRKLNGASIYLKNLNNIVNDIYLEVLKRDKINYMFRSLTVISVLPLFFIRPVQSWAENNFPALTNFYSSSFGFMVQILILVSIFASYFLLRVIREDSEIIKFDKITKQRWQEKVYKWPFINQIVNNIMPKKYTSKNRKATELIKNTNSFLTIEWLYVNKITSALIAFVLVFTLILNIKYIDVDSIYNQVSEEFLTLGKLSDEDSEIAKESAKNDAAIVKTYKNDKTVTKEQIAADVGADLTNKADKAKVDRIYGKITKLQQTYLKWWELIISLLVGVIAFYFPNLILIIRNKIRELEKENEIMQFQSVILMLMYIERIDVQVILEWLERYSYAFKEVIATALNNYEAGELEALEILKDKVANKDFKRIIDGLISSVDRIPIKDAFDELETERTFYYEKRKESNERIIQKKVTMGKAIGFTPMVILIGGYLVGPLMLVSIMQMTNYFNQMGAT